MKIRPLQDRLIVKRVTEENKTKGGIIIPDSAKEKPLEAKVVAVGNGKILEDGKIRAMDIKAGDTILFSKYAGTEIKIEGEDIRRGEPPVGQPHMREERVVESRLAVRRQVEYAVLRRVFCQHRPRCLVFKVALA